MKILLVTGHFAPEIHPRAFRALELALEFVRMGHVVRVVTLRSVEGFDYKSFENENGLSIENLNLYQQLDVISSRSLQGSCALLLKSVKVIRFLIDYFIGGRLFVNSVRIGNRLDTTVEWDLVMSFSNPFMNHLALALFRKRFKDPQTVFIADSGDPFFRSQQTKRAPYFFYLERYVYSRFDYLTIPAIESRPAYFGLINSEKVRIIPQGIDFTDMEFGEVSGFGKVVFAYSGVFYDDIRNPNFLLEALVDLDMDYCFEIYLRQRDAMTDTLLNKFKCKLGNRLKIAYGLDRRELLFRLSSVDFLVNISNLTTTQLPSKLIDYGIVKRPIYSCDSRTFDKRDLLKFLKRDYSESMYVDPSPYDIKRVAKSFFDLYDETKKRC